MSDALIQKKRSEGEQEIVLRLLERVADDNEVSQAGFAKQVGIAKGLANSYFNRCLKKGWIKLRQIPKQRFLYYLTPKGFAEKANLTAQFLSYSYQFYRDARADLGVTMETAGAKGHKRLAVLGDGELAEIAAIVSDETPIVIVGFIAVQGGRQRIAGRPVVKNWQMIGKADAAILATLDDTRELFETFRQSNPDVPVYVPEQLKSLVWDK